MAPGRRPTGILSDTREETPSSTWITAPCSSETKTVSAMATWAGTFININNRRLFFMGYPLRGCGLQKPPDDGQRGRRVNDPARDPHQKAGQLLVLDRCQSQWRHPQPGIVHVPGTLGKRLQGAECATDQGGEEKADDG